MHHGEVHLFWDAGKQSKSLRMVSRDANMGAPLEMDRLNYYK